MSDLTLRDVAGWLSSMECPQKAQKVEEAADTIESLQRREKVLTDALRGLAIQHASGVSGVRLCLLCRYAWDRDDPERHAEGCALSGPHSSAADAHDSAEACIDGCQYAKDIAMPEYSCGERCMYKQRPDDSAEASTNARPAGVAHTADSCPCADPSQPCAWPKCGREKPVWVEHTPEPPRDVQRDAERYRWLAADGDRARHVITTYCGHEVQDTIDAALAQSQEQARKDGGA